MPGSAEMEQAELDIVYHILFRLRPSPAAAEMVSCGACQSRAMGEEASWDTGNDARLGVPAKGLHCSSLDAL